MLTSEEKAHLKYILQRGRIYSREKGWDSSTSSSESTKSSAPRRTSPAIPMTTKPVYVPKRAKNVGLEKTQIEDRGNIWVSLPMNDVWEWTKEHYTNVNSQGKYLLKLQRELRELESLSADVHKLHDYYEAKKTDNPINSNRRKATLQDLKNKIMYLTDYHAKLKYVVDKLDKEYYLRLQNPQLVMGTFGGAREFYRAHQYIMNLINKDMKTIKKEL